jgi:hypothetical protein
MCIFGCALPLQAIELLKQYFGCTLCAAHDLPFVAQAYWALIRDNLKDHLSMVLYDVTTLHFQSSKKYDFQRLGLRRFTSPNTHRFTWLSVPPLDPVVLVAFGGAKVVDLSH